MQKYERAAMLGYMYEYISCLVRYYLGVCWEGLRKATKNLVTDQDSNLTLPPWGSSSANSLVTLS